MFGGAQKYIFNEEHPGAYEDRAKHFFEHARFLHMLKDWIMFFVEDDELRKTILPQHQARAAELRQLGAQIPPVRGPRSYFKFVQLPRKSGSRLARSRSRGYPGICRTRS